MTPAIETERQVSCPLCATAGTPLYEDLVDRLFGAPGRWGLKTCAACGALWLDPRPTRASIGEAYRTYYTHGKTSAVSDLAAAAIRRVARERAAQRHGFGRPTPGLAALCALAAGLYPGLADHAEGLIGHLPASALGSDARLLDVGCGDGETLSFLADLGWRTTGLELDPLAVQAARARGLEVIEGDLASAGLADESFEAVTSRHVLEHLHDPAEFLIQSRRVLKTGGLLVAMTPNARSELLARHGRHWRGLEPPRHLVLFNADNLARLASDVGLREVTVKRTARLASFMHIASARIAADSGDPAGARGVRLWLESKILEARMADGLRRGRGEGAELVLIARK